MSRKLEQRIEQLAQELADLKLRHERAVEGLRDRLQSGGCPVLWKEGGVGGDKGQGTDLEGCEPPGPSGPGRD